MLGRWHLLSSSCLLLLAYPSRPHSGNKCQSWIHQCNFWCARVWEIKDKPRRTSEKDREVFCLTYGLQFFSTSSLLLLVGIVAPCFSWIRILPSHHSEQIFHTLNSKWAIHALYNSIHILLYSSKKGTKCRQNMDWHELCSHRKPKSSSYHIKKCWA